jgi:hypothetical protein
MRRNSMIGGGNMKAKSIRLLLIASVILLSFKASVQGSGFKDNFPQGKPELRWAPFPFF